MSRLNQPQLPAANPTTTALTAALGKILKPLIDQVNAASGGQASAVFNAATAAPSGTTTLPFSQGDFIKNSAVAELGSAGSKYVIVGWICTVPGKPGTWVQCRFLTGN